MADTSYKLRGAAPTVYSAKLHDNGDGTYAPVVYLSGATIEPIGDWHILDTGDNAIDPATSGNQTTIITKLTDLNTAIGTKSDAAWDGVSASPSLISIMKAVALHTAP
jgi:hypothetical protein